MSMAIIPGVGQYQRFHQMSQNMEELEQKYGVDPKRWNCVYPCYININKTLQEGISYKGVNDIFTIPISHSQKPEIHKIECVI